MLARDLIRTARSKRPATLTRYGPLSGWWLPDLGSNQGPTD
jgi:hypothetical protein